MFWIGVDTGGTFTDLVVMDDDHSISLFKSLSTPESPGESVFDVLEQAAATRGMSLREFLQQTEQFIHGTTIVTNAVISGAHAKAALLTNSGYEDMLMFGLGSKGKPPSEMFRTHQDYPDPIIPRHLTYGIRGRLNAEGGVETPLDDAQVKQVVEELAERKVESVAISFLWSITNPEHELRVAELVREGCPGASVSIGHQISSVVREYERTSTCALDAAVKPLFAGYVDALLTKLRANGYERDLLMVNSHGGVQAAEELSRFPVYALKSGPSLGPVAGVATAESEGKGIDLVICDMGGTSFDVSMVVGGHVQTALMDQVGPYHYTFPTLDIQSIGAGGGSIGWVDSGGLVHVGPQSAGSSPGPACYGLGGTLPTVTDANVVLGYISPDFFMGGAMEISGDLAHEAVETHIADPMGISVEEAASLIYTTVNQNMVLGLSQVSIQKGIDPRGYLIVGGGGCSPAHLVAIAQELDISEVLIPKISPVLCAFGMLTADLSYEKAHSVITKSNDFAFDEVTETLRDLRDEGRQFLERAGVSDERQDISFSVMASYPYQSWEIEVPLPWDQVLAGQLPELIELFNSVHKRTYGFSIDDEAVQFVSWRVRARGIRDKPEPTVTAAAGGENPSEALKGVRDAYFVEVRGFVETPVYDGTALAAGNRITGPAIIEELATTVVVPHDTVVAVTEYGGYLLRIPKLKARGRASSGREESG